MATSSSFQTPPETFTLEILSGEEIDEFYRLIKEGQTQRYKFLSMRVTVVMNGETDTTSLVAINEIGTDKVLMSHEQIKIFSGPGITGATCSVCPGLYATIKNSRPAHVALPFSTQAKASIFVPLTKETAANVVLAFFNAHQDPLDRINLVVDNRKEGARAEAGRILTTYYLSCIKYLTELNLHSLIRGDPKCEPMLDDTQLVSGRQRHTYNSLKTTKREIPKELVSFHAVYGAYVMCRPVATKRSFREWVGKRYSTFLSSIQYTPESNVNLLLQTGGTQVNETVSERPILRKLIYAITKMESDSIVVSAIKNHVSFLTSLSEMTTYSLIQQVLIQGGAIIMMPPMSKQIAKYADERESVAQMMIDEGIPPADIVYLHLIKPGFQCFKSVDYPDLIKTAQIIDSIMHPTDKTLENYKAKIQGATCDERKIRQFLSAHSSIFCWQVDTTEMEKIRKLLGAAADSLYEEAQQVVDLLKKQSRVGEN